MADELVNLVPLVRDELSDIRYGLHKSMVRSIISDMKIGDHTNIREIKGKVVKKFSIGDFPNEVLERIMNEFAEEGLLQEHKNNYLIVESMVIQSIDALIDKCYVEFARLLKDSIRDFDVHIDKDFKNAFGECVRYVINSLINEQNSINNVSLDYLKYEVISIELHNYIIKYKHIKNQDHFLSLFYNYLKSGEKYITNLLFIVYQSSVAYDLLKRGRQLPKIAEHIGDGGILFLDTNVIVSLICKNDRTYDLAKSVIKLANNIFHFKIGYCRITSKEFENLLRWADLEMKSGRLPNKTASENQLILDFTRRTSCKWSDYYTELAMYRAYLKNDFNIDLFEYDNLELDLDENGMEIISYIDAIYSYVSRETDEKNERSYEALMHDKTLFKILVNLKKEEASGLNTPWIMSFDNTLNGINQTLIKANKFTVPEGGYSIHPRTLLNTLLVFSNIDFNEDNQRDFVKSIVNYMIIPAAPLTESQYAKLIAYKVPGLNEMDIETILHFFRLSPLKSQLDKALENNDIDSASQTVSKMMLDPKAVEVLISERKTKEENERLRQALARLRLEKEELMDKSKPISITFNVNLPDIDSTTRDLIVVLVKQIGDLSPEIYKEANLNGPDSKELSRDKLSSILASIDKCISKGGEVATKLQPIIGLVSLIKTAIGL